MFSISITIYVLRRSPPFPVRLFYSLWSLIFHSIFLAPSQLSLSRSLRSMVFPQLNVHVWGCRVRALCMVRLCVWSFVSHFLHPAPNTTHIHDNDVCTSIFRVIFDISFISLSDSLFPILSPSPTEFLPTPWPTFFFAVGSSRSPVFGRNKYIMTAVSFYNIFRLQVPKNNPGLRFPNLPGFSSNTVSYRSLKMWSLMFLSLW